MLRAKNAKKTLTLQQKWWVFYQLLYVCFQAQNKKFPDKHVFLPVLLYDLFQALDPGFHFKFVTASTFIRPPLDIISNDENTGIIFVTLHVASRKKYRSPWR